MEAPMLLTSDQIEAIKQGEPVRIFPTEVGADCVMLRADVFDKVQILLGREWSDDDLRAIAVRTFADADAAEPIQP
jgi:hypothetical protein